MPKDYANIYNLSEEEFALETCDLWIDAVPGTSNLADNLLKKIVNDECPYVLSVEASYGMGKTYFFTRFCEHAKKNGYNCIYLSAWENDYQPSPFCFITKEIISYLETCNKSCLDSKIAKIKTYAINIIKKILWSSSCYKEINNSLFSININFNQIQEIFFEKKDEVKEFKKDLVNMLVEMNIKPLIIIVDDLDRCRPDYALKTLEIIKHFFDISNLYIILPVNNVALEQAVISTYGQISTPEKYMRKMITEEYILPIPKKENYKKIIETHITENSIKNAMQRNFIEMNDNFNGFYVIADLVSQYAFNGKLTYRELVKVCNEFICIVNKIDRKIRIEYLVYKLCSKYKTVVLNSSHPFAISTYGTSHKNNILKIKDLNNLTYQLYNNLSYNSFEKDYRSVVEGWHVKSDSFETYEDLYKYANDVLEYKDIILQQNMRTYYAKDNFMKFFNAVENAKNEALEYQRKYGSSDKDEEEHKYYDEIISNNLCLYDDNRKKAV